MAAHNFCCCESPEWWYCNDRGCYVEAKSAYGDGMRKRDQERGYRSLGAYEIEYSPSGDPMNIVTKRNRK